MRRILAILLAALFAAVTLSAYAADPAPQGDQPKAQKHSKKKKKSSGSTGGSDVKAGGESVNQPGRGDPTVGTGGGDIKTAPSNAPGRSDSK